MPAVSSTRRTVSSSFTVNHLRTRSSPYPSRTALGSDQVRKARRSVDGLRARGRQVLAEIDWWTIMAGQLPGPGSGSSAEPSDSDASSMYTREDAIMPEVEVERVGFAMDVGEICSGSSPSLSGSAMSVSSGRSSPFSSCWSSPRQSVTPQKISRCVSPARPRSRSTSPSRIVSVLPSTTSCTQSGGDARTMLHRSLSFSGTSSPRYHFQAPTLASQARSVTKRRL